MGDRSCRLPAVGLMSDKAAADFVDSCAGSFSAPEVERDLLKVPHASLAEAVNFHTMSMSISTCISLVFVCPSNIVV